MRPAPSESSSGTATRIVAIWAGECVAALLVLLQRLTGGVESFPAPAAVLIFGVVCFAVNLMATALLRAAAKGTGPFFGWAFFSRNSSLAEKWTSPLFCVAPPLVIGLSLLPPDATGKRAVLWACALLTAATTAWMFRRTDCQSVLQTPRDDALFSQDSESRLNEIVQESNPPAEPEITPSLIPVPITDPPLQSMQRRLTDDGRETVEGEFTAVFAAGQKQAVVHLSFCPPLPGIPDIECEPLDGPDVRWKLAVVQPYGVRIDVQRSGPCDLPAICRLAWFACSEPRIAEAA